MEKILSDIYTYLDVRVLIQNDFWQRSEKNPSFSLRSYASKLSVSPGFLSQYLGGKKNISSKKLKVLLENIGLTDDEIDYGLSLAEMGRYSSHNIPQDIKDKVTSKYIFPKTTNSSCFSALLDSKYHFIISILASPNGVTREEMFLEFSKLKNDRGLFDEALSDLIKGELLIEEDDLIKKVENFVVTDSNLRVMKQNKSLSLLVHDNIIEHADYDDNHISNGLTIQLKKEQIPLARKITVKALHDLMRMSKENSSDSEDQSVMIYTQEYIVLE